ncbi:arsenate reductase ArsC, partial [Limosilactobacillus fermentum]
WGLDDPTGLGDDKFNQVIDQLEERVKELKEALQTTKLGR